MSPSTKSRMMFPTSVEKNEKKAKIRPAAGAVAADPGAAPNPRRDTSAVSTALMMIRMTK